jgi:broad specificity phosphatase PhoE
MLPPGNEALAISPPYDEAVRSRQPWATAVVLPAGDRRQDRHLIGCLEWCLRLRNIAVDPDATGRQDGDESFAVTRTRSSEHLTDGCAVNLVATRAGGFPGGSEQTQTRHRLIVGGAIAGGGPARALDRNPSRLCAAVLCRLDGMATSVLLVRHGQSTWNAARRWQGQADPPLSEAGQQQAAHAATKLGVFDVVVASDLERARHTAEIIAGALGIGPVLLDDRLRENDAGEWTGKTHDEIETEWPGWVAAGRRPPGFESGEQIVTRMLAILLALGREYPGATIFGVSHGGVLRQVRQALGGDPEPGFPNLAGQWFSVEQRDVQLNGGIVRLIEDGEMEALSDIDRDRV